MRQYRVNSRTALHYYFVESDIQDMLPEKGGVRFVLNWNAENAADKRFKVERMNKSLSLYLEHWQALEVVEQHRDSKKGFCDGNGEGCYDYGRGEPPAACVRCTLLAAIQASGGGDLRQNPTEANVAPVRQHGTPGLVFAFVVLFGIWWLTLMAWSRACGQIEDAQRELARVRREKRP